MANFSSAHPFRFEDGTELAACDEAWSKAMALEATEITKPSPCGRFQLVSLSFAMSPAVRDALEQAAKLNVDIVLCPLPVIELLRAQPLAQSIPVFAGIRRTDRVSGKIHVDRFCV